MSWFRTLLISLSPGSPIKRAVKLSAIDTPRAARAIMRLARAHQEKLGSEPFADALKRIQHPALVDVVMEQMRLDNQRHGPLTALNLLHKMRDPRFVPALLVQLKGQGASNAASLLADIGDKRAVGGLCEVLLDGTRSPYDRSAAANALGKLADSSAVTALLQVLKPEFEKVDQSLGGNRVFTAVADAVGRIGDNDAIVALAGLLEGFSAEAQAKDVAPELYWRYDAIAKSLQHTRSPRTTQGLLSVLEVNSRSLRGRTDLVRSLQRHVITALGKVADPASLDRILAAYSDREFMCEAAEALEAFPDPRAQEIVAEYQKKKERCFLCGKDEMRAMVTPSASAIARAGGDQTVALLVSYVEDVCSGTSTTVKCSCGMWACHGCLAAKMTPYGTYECPGCHRSFIGSLDLR